MTAGVCVSVSLSLSLSLSLCLCVCVYVYVSVCRRGVVALGLGTKPVADSAVLVLNDPRPPGQVRSVGFCLAPALPEAWGDVQGDGGGGGAGEAGAGGAGERAVAMSVMRIHMGKKLCQRMASLQHLRLLRAQSADEENGRGAAAACGAADARDGTVGPSPTIGPSPTVPTATGLLSQVLEEHACDAPVLRVMLLRQWAAVAGAAG